MDNSFEQQFVQNVKNNISEDSQAANIKIESSHKFIFIIAIIISVISLIELVILAILLINFTSTIMFENDSEDSVDEVEIAANSPYVWDNEGDLIAVGITCKNQNNASFTLTKTNKFTMYDDSSNIIDTGSYSIVNDSLIPLSGSTNQEKVLYYDGFVLADGTDIYECE